MTGPHSTPAAEVDVTPELVRQLLAAQQRDLAHLPVELLANGWDNVVYRVGDELVARLPRREVAAGLLAHEQRWLPVLAPRLPLNVPAPLRIGQPGSGYPWRWSIVAFLPGRVAARNPPADFSDAARVLGKFLAALHTPAASDAPVNPFRGVPLADRRTTFEQNLNLTSGLVDRQAVLRLWEAAVGAPPWDRAPVWLHGDLHPANILIHRGRVSGVIDFGDMTSGDPAADLSVAWMLLPAQCHDDFQNAYRAASDNAGNEGIWARARGWALAFSLMFLAHCADDRLLTDIGRHTMNAVLDSSGRPA